MLEPEKIISSGGRHEKNISVEFTNERIIPSGGLAVVGAILGKGNPCLKRTVKRRRRRTAINNLANMARHITEHARKLVIGLGKSNVWREAFQYVHYAFEDFVL